MTCVTNPADMEITRGNNWPPMRWQFLTSENPDVLFDLTGSIFKLTVQWPGTTIVKSSDVDPELAVDLTNSIVTWNYTIAQSRLMPLGRVGRYELERWIDGSQQSLINGGLAVTEGLNPD